MKIIAATNNENKLREFKQILEPFGFEVVSQSEAGVDINPSETGTTFKENAILKAKALQEATGCAALADDSGLEVNYLCGAPGVHSARYASGSDEERNNKLLLELKDITDRHAKFVSVVALCFPDGRIITSYGECGGQITYEPKGENGFGYDPIFLVNFFNKTYAELSSNEKNAVSHRSTALRVLNKKLQQEKF